RPLRELRHWDWSRRLADAGVQRLQVDQTVTREELEDFLEEVLARLTLRAIDTSEARQMRPSAMRFGAVGIAGAEMPSQEVVTASIDFSLREEAETVNWLHEELQAGRDLPLREAEAVVRALSAAMHGDQELLLPL